MDNQTLQRVRELLSQHEQIAILVGKNPNIDEMGAALSLYLALISVGKKATIASATQPLVEVSNLVGIDEVKTKLSGEGGDLVVSFPYKEGEVEKVSYTLDDKFLNIVVKAGELGLSFVEKDVLFQRSGALPTLMFMVGVPRLTDLGALFDPAALKDTTVVNIDNKEDNQGFGDVVLVSPRFSSVSEQIAQLLHSLEITIDIDIAQNLLSGLSFATDNFQSPNTSYIAFEIAGQLMEKGARRPTLRASAMPSQQQSDDFAAFFGSKPQPFDPSFDQPVAQPQVKQGFTPQQNQQPRQRFDQNQRRNQNQDLGQRQYDQGGQRQNQPKTQPQPQQQNRQPFDPGKPEDQNAVVDKKDQGKPAEQSLVGNPQDKQGKQSPPPDWLMPKVYKGSSNV